MTRLGGARTAGAAAGRQTSARESEPSRGVEFVLSERAADQTAQKSPPGSLPTGGLYRRKKAAATIILRPLLVAGKMAEANVDVKPLNRDEFKHLFDVASGAYDGNVVGCFRRSTFSGRGEIPHRR